MKDAYMKNKELRGCSDGVQEYLERSTIHMDESQMMLIGRTPMDFDIEDTLFTPKDNPIHIYGFHLYGHFVDFISAGCTCGIICSTVDEKFAVGSGEEKSESKYRTERSVGYVVL